MHSLKIVKVTCWAQKQIVIKEYINQDSISIESEQNTLNTKKSDYE